MTRTTTNDLIMVPAKDAELGLASAGQSEFPAGPWQGRIDVVRSRSIPVGSDGTPFAGFATDDGEVLGIQLGSNQPLEGQDPVGDRKIFVDICTRDGEYDLTNVSLKDRGVAHWKLQQSARLVVNLAIALGQAELQDANGDGTFWTAPSNFVDALRRGEFDGLEIGFKVQHRRGKGANKGKIYAGVESFFAAS